MSQSIQSQSACNWIKIGQSSVMITHVATWLRSGTQFLSRNTHLSVTLKVCERCDCHTQSVDFVSGRFLGNLGGSHPIHDKVLRTELRFPSGRRNSTCELKHQFLPRVSTLPILAACLPSPPGIWGLSRQLHNHKSSLSLSFPIYFSGRIPWAEEPDRL